MKAIFVSFFGSQNIGDNLIVSSLSDVINTEFEIDKYNFALDNNEYLKKNDDFTLVKNDTNILRKIYKEWIRNIDVVDYVHKLRNNKRTLSNPNIKEFRDNLSKVDALIIGGGNMMYDLTKHSDSYLRVDILVDMAIKMKKPIYFISIGIGPFQSKRQIDNVMTTLCKADYVTFRDAKFKEYMSEIDLSHDHFYQSIDPVFLLENRKPLLIKDKFCKIGVCIMDYRLNKVNDKEYLEYVNSMVSLIEKLLMLNYEIYLYSSAKEDYNTVNEVYAYFLGNKKIELVEIKSENELISLYQNIDLVIATRMHALIVAVSQYVPIVGISWQPKVEEMFKLITQMDSVFQINKLNEEIEQIIKNITNKAENYIVERNKLVKFKDEANKSFRINIELLKKLKNDVKSIKNNN